VFRILCEWPEGAPGRLRSSPPDDSEQFRPAPRTFRCFRGSLSVRYAAIAAFERVPEGEPMLDVRRREFITLLGGAAIAWPLAARAQQSERIRSIGFFSPISENDPDNQNWIRGFTQRLEELGWVNGRNVRIDFRFAAADSSRMPRLATELLESRPEVLVAATIGPATALRQQTLSIPIVFVLIPDPVAAGFVTNLARPEGNITGFTNFEFSIGEKWLQLLKECLPSVGRIAVVFDPANPSWAPYLRAIEAAARPLGLVLTPAGVRGAAEIQERLAAFAQGPNSALIVVPSPITVGYRKTILQPRTGIASNLSVSLFHT
jgi:putative ABC transport system substrate-binding protein